MNDFGEPARSILHGKYEISGEIGRGGMGVVYKGIQRSLGRTVAIKLLPAQLSDNEQYLQRFRREAEALGRLNHPNIVTIHDLETDAGENYLVMEFVDGRSLGAILSSREPLPTRVAIDIATQVALALDAAHRCGIVHRDVKPENILIDRASGRVKVTDFGIAAMAGSKFRTDTGTMVGTPKYMAPEQVQGTQVTGTADIYALGVVLYEMLSGRVPFVGDTPMTIAYQHVDATPPALATLAPHVPASLARIVERALEKQPERRFSSAGEMAEALRAIDLPAETTAIRRPRKGSRLFSRLSLTLGACAVAAVATVLIVRVLQGPRTAGLGSPDDAAPPAPASEPGPGTDRGERMSSLPPGSDAGGEAATPARPPAAPPEPRAGTEEPARAERSRGPTARAPSAAASPEGDRADARPSPSTGETPQIGGAETRSGIAIPIQPSESRQERTEQPRTQAEQAEAPPPQVQTPQAQPQTPVEPPTASPQEQHPKPDPLAARAQLDRETKRVYDRALEAFRLGSYASAIAGFREYLTRNPESAIAADAQHAIAEAYFRQSDYARAVTEYQVLVDRYPSSEWTDDSRYAIGYCSEKQKDLSSAVRAYREFLAAHPTSQLVAEAHYRIGFCLYAQQDYAGALTAFRSCLETSPPGKFADEAQYSIAECLYRQGDYAGAIREYARMISAHPSSEWADDAQYSTAWAYAKSGDFARAAEECARLEQSYPESARIPGALLLRANSLMQLGDRKTARTTAEDLLRRFPGAKEAADARDLLARLK